jgi:hypothetical protein
MFLGILGNPRVPAKNPWAGSSRPKPAVGCPWAGKEIENPTQTRVWRGLVATTFYAIMHYKNSLSYYLQFLCTLHLI